LASTLAHAQAAAPPPAESAATCLIRKLAQADDADTIGALRSACASEAPTAGATAPPLMTQHLDAERDVANHLYTITAHHANYFLLGSYAAERPGNATFTPGGASGIAAQKVESKFQISLKALLMQDAFNGAGDIFAGYTQRSFWQMYNRSAPFRETDYEPELWLRRVVNTSVLGWNVSTVALGLNHQSNGRGDDYSRSWNRVLGSVALERGDYAVVVRPWWRIPEAEAKDNNPDITKYMGRFDLNLLARYGQNSFALMLRNNLAAHENRGAVQLGWTYPLTPTIKAYLQLFSGYGESLIDYKLRQTSVGAGIQLLDW
jgi:phospholipase A1